MKHFTIQDIRSWQPCYDPSRYLPEDFKGTALDILCNDAIPIQDRFWVVLHKEITSERVMRLFEVHCAREALKLVQNPDVRSTHAVDTAERYALGQATEEELVVAAWSAVWAAEALQSAAWSAAEAAEAAARAADAPQSATWTTAWSAGRSAEAERSADAAAQKNKLIEILIEEEARNE